MSSSHLGGQDSAHASASRWRHQESSSYLRHASKARDPVSASSTGDLADFLNASRVESHGTGGHHQPITLAVAAGTAHDGRGSMEAPDGREIICGPLLNYRRMSEERWYGSVLIVVKGGGLKIHHQPTLTLRRLGRTDEVDLQLDGVANDDSKAGKQGRVQVQGERLYSDMRATFWAFAIDAPLEPGEVKYEYRVPDMRFSSAHKPQTNSFFIPAANESMRIMFHSCNGFSVGTDEAAYSGAPLWNDVLRKHQRTALHVMIGGGDQIYNDGIRVTGPLRAWTDIASPRKRRDFPFAEKLRAECDDYYLNNYVRWFNTEPFAQANGQIPQLNIWDDHDIIDGFGSYTHHFMRCHVFRGIGGTAHKYYMLFQHHLPPPPSTYTSDHVDENGDAQGPDPNQLVNTFVAAPRVEEQYIVGPKPGPYVAEHSFNIYSRLGARIALVGIDARTERTRHQVNYPETYELIFERLRNELGAAASSPRPIKHLILLLGIPIAYPRLTWLENVFRSPVMGPIKFLNRRFGLGGGLFNHFDGSVDLLDDLDDHYTARTHKAERAELMRQLQAISSQFSVRVTILGGDVHLAALGRFYSNPKLGVPAEQDVRYMVNVISSAIVNKPPPQAVANLLARRNKIHHLNHDTDETLLDLFDKDPGGKSKTAAHNHCTMPSRNYALLTENSPNAPATSNQQEHQSFLGRDGHAQLHWGEVGAGSSHKAALVERHGHGNNGSLDVSINVEIDQHSAQGETQGYGLSVPVLRVDQGEPRSLQS
ncbi:hypothetical protein CDD82_4812 [Ophiocordyceps australis]|uniref:PhoD-like phosphatase domain-containing protein n=1 Tax=Ophiocordyceps australis TaxID=1399860 RepID=A0A2C5Z400_9HYPO|nr:hypothetical protein CDD82_4812 [Ophiocordyceps australis]